MNILKPTPEPSFEYAFHELANEHPLMEGDEFDNLVEDIRKHGILDPIMLYQGMILDGRNRYRAAKACERHRAPWLLLDFYAQ